METLPIEIIQCIISQKNLSIKDVVNFSLTNRYNYLVATSCNIIWKKEYFKTWPQYVKLFDNKFRYHWYAEVGYIYDLKRRTPEIISTMSSRFLKINRVLSNSDFTEWFELYQEKPQTYYYLTDYLMNIVNTDVPIESIETVPIATPGNKTLQYYAKKVLMYLGRLHSTNEWRTFIALPQKLQTLEKGMVFVGQWFHPISVSWNIIAAELDELTEEVKKNLKTENPTHPLFFVPREQLEIWRNENIECDKYDFSDSMQIKRAMAGVIQFLLNKLYLFSNIFLTVQVLQEIIGCGVDAIFLIIYESIGRRLGIKFEPIIDTTGLYLGYLKSNNTEEHEYIEFHRSHYGCVRQYTQYETTNFAVATTQQVFKLIAKRVQASSSPLPSRIPVEILCSLLEFLELVSPFDVSIKRDLARVYMHHNMDPTSYIEALMQQKNHAHKQIEPIISILQQYQTNRSDNGRLFRKVEPKIRPTNLKYAVGMVMECPVDYSHRRTCVICDWECSALDEEPVYGVLVPLGSYLKIAESELEKLPRMRLSWDLSIWWFKNIGRYFSHRFETVFVPNAEKEREYPADAAVRNMYNEQIKPWY